MSPGNRPHPTSLGLTTSLVEGGALIWSSPSAGAAGRLVRPADRTPFGVAGLTIWGRATAARTARRLGPHSTIWQHGWGQHNGNGCVVPCRLPPLPPRSLRSLRAVGGSTVNYADGEDLVAEPDDGEWVIPGVQDMGSGEGSESATQPATGHRESGTGSVSDQPGGGDTRADNGSRWWIGIVISLVSTPVLLLMTLTFAALYLSNPSFGLKLVVIGITVVTIVSRLALPYAIYKDAKNIKRSPAGDRWRPFTLAYITGTSLIPPPVEYFTAMFYLFRRRRKL